MNRNKKIKILLHKNNNKYKKNNVIKKKYLQVILELKKLINLKKQVVITPRNIWNKKMSRRQNKRTLKERNLKEKK